MRMHWDCKTEPARSAASQQHRAHPPDSEVDSAKRLQVRDTWQRSALSEGVFKEADTKSPGGYPGQPLFHTGSVFPTACVPFHVSLFLRAIK